METFCPHHDHHTDAIENNSAGIAAFTAKESTIKWVIGIFLTISICAAGICTTVITGKMSDIANELKDIKSAVHSIAIDQAQFKAEIDGIKWRIDQLERGRK